MKSKYSLGIVIPVYNVEEYLEECLESVANQTVPFDEVILVNDGSSDRSKQICERYCKKYSYFQLINQENLGLGAARNHGMAHLKSDYFVFLDSDDYIVLWMAETIKNKLNGQDILFYAAQICEDMEGITHLNTYFRKETLCNHLMSGLEFFHKSFPQNYIVSACMAAYQRSFLENCNISFPEGIYYEDNLFYIETIIHAEKVESISEQLYVRRYRPGSIMTSAVGRKNCLDKMDVEIKIWDCIRKNPGALWQKEVLCNYLLSGMSEVMGITREYEREKEIEKFEIVLMEKFWEYWGVLCQENLRFLHNYFTVLRIYRKMAEGNEDYKINYKKIKTIFLEKIKQKLEGLHLEEGRTVGIYGMGKHTKAMFRLYEKYVGEIQCQYFYIVSDCSEAGSDHRHGSHKIVSYENIPENTNSVIVSSLVYMDDMIKNLMDVNVTPKKICTLYQPGEQLDLVVVDEFIENVLERDNLSA